MIHTKARRLAETELRKEWGADYRANVSAAGNLVSRTCPAFAGDLLNARVKLRGKRGTVQLGNHPAFLRWAYQIERELNPPLSLTPSTAPIFQRLAEIRKVRQSHPGRYDRDKKMQYEELSLVGARDRLLRIPDAVLKIDAVAAWLGVSKRTIQRHAALPRVALSARRIGYRVGDVLSFLSRRTKR